MSITELQARLDALDEAELGYAEDEVDQKTVLAARAAVIEEARRVAEQAGEPVAWLPVVGFEGIYEVSSGGRIRRARDGRLLSNSSKAGAGYIKRDLSRDGVRTQTYLHRVVCEAFNGPSEGRQVNHKDGDKENNAASNLEWVTASENANHSYYVLGNKVRKIEAFKNYGDEPALRFESVEQAVRAGFDSAHIYRSINKDGARHKGFLWRFASTPPSADALVEALGKLSAEWREPSGLAEAFDTGRHYCADDLDDLIAKHKETSR